MPRSTIPETLHPQQRERLQAEAAIFQQLISKHVACNSLTDIKFAIGVLVEEWKEQCPLLHDIIRRLTTTSSTSRCTVQTTASRLQHGVLLLSSLCYVQSQTHNTIPHFLGLFLHSCGVQQTALDALHAIGLTSPYSTLLKWMNNYTLS